MNEDFKQTNIYLNNTRWFKKTYDNLIKKASSRGLDKKKLSYYTEKHHIIPRCRGGNNENNNLVLLTFREHVIAHMLLSRIYDNDDNLALALHFLLCVERGGEKVKICSTRWMSELKNALTRQNHNRVYTEETRKKMSEARKNTVMTEESRKKAAKSRVGLNMTDESKKNKSIALTGKIVSEKTKKLISKKSSQRIQGPDGTIYESQIECAKALGVCTRTVWKMIHKKPELGYKFLNNKSKKVIGPDGTIYDSMRKCASNIGKDTTTLRTWIEKYPEQGYKYYTDEQQ